MTHGGWKAPSTIPGEGISRYPFFSVQGSVDIPVDIPRPWTSLWTSSRVVANSTSRRSSTIAPSSRLLFQVMWASSKRTVVAGDQPNRFNNTRDNSTASIAVMVTGAWESDALVTCVARASRSRCNV